MLETDDHPLRGTTEEFHEMRLRVESLNRASDKLRQSIEDFDHALALVKGQIDALDGRQPGFFNPHARG